MKLVWWIGVALALLILSFAAGRIPYFPGDIVAALWIQNLVPGGRWADLMTETAKLPWSLLLLGAILIVGSRLVGGRIALLSIPSFLGMWLLGILMKGWLFRPRPSSDLIEVAGSLSGSSFPSSFALAYGSLFGFLLWASLSRGKGGSRIGLALASLVLLAAGGAARIVPGAHWPSDVLISYAIALMWVGILFKIFDSLDRRRL